MQTKAIVIEELLHKVDELARTLEDREEVDGDEWAIARDLVDELRDEIYFRLD